MVEKVPGLFDTVPIVAPDSGNPTPIFHRWWRVLADKVDTLVAAGETIVFSFDCGTATVTGIPGVTLEGGTA